MANTFGKIFKIFIIGVAFVLTVMSLYSLRAAETDSKFQYNDHNRRDPFWRLVLPDGTVLSYDTDLMISDMVLEGVIFDPNGKSLAIINGKVLKVGDRLGLFTLTEIHRGYVILTKANKRYVLQMKKEE